MSGDSGVLGPLLTWRSAITDSKLSADARHVALTLSLHMSERGDSCFPSQATLASETGRRKASVIAAIQEIERAGFLDVQRPEVSGRGHVTHYRARTPKGTPSEPFSKGSAQAVQTVPVEARKGTQAEPEDVKPLGRTELEDVQPRTRRRDPLFEAICEVTNTDWHDLTKRGRDKLNGERKQLADAGATPDEIRRRAENWSVTYGVPLTSNALVTHWAELGSPRPPPRRVRGAIEEFDAMMREAMRDGVESSGSPGEADGGVLSGSVDVGAEHRSLDRRPPGAG